MGITNFFNKSFATSDKVKCWDSEKNKLKPKDVSLCSNKKFWFNCDKCSHSFNIRLDSVNNGIWCSYCANKKLCDKEDCKICFDKSFASYDKAKYWDFEKK